MPAVVTPMVSVSFQVQMLYRIVSYRIVQLRNFHEVTNALHCKK